MEDRPTPAGFHDDWTLARNAFHQFLKWLDNGVDSGGQRYLEIRRRLVLYFGRKNCAAADELADETLTRVARRLAEEGQIRDAVPAQYCYTVARFVFLEYRRQPAQSQLNLDTLPSIQRALAYGQPHSESQEAEDREKLLRCLEICIHALPPQRRELIVEYYRGDFRVKIEVRRRLAERLGVTANALSIQACRIRERLAACVRDCCNRP